MRVRTLVILALAAVTFDAVLGAAGATAQSFDQL